MSGRRGRVVGLLATVAAVGALASAGSPAAPRAALAAAGGTVQTWGDNSFGQLGTGSSASESDSPVSVGGLSGVRAIAAGDSFDLALLANGTVQSWGVNDSGELGDGDSSGPDQCQTTVACSMTPEAVPGLSNVVAISAGYQHSLALLGDGTVQTWGDNTLGELGNGGDQGPDSCSSGAYCSMEPAPVPGLSNIVAVSAGYFYSLALRRDGTVWGWGLLPGASNEVDSPTQLPGLSNVTAISAGAVHALAIVSGGAVLAWGDDSDGELGDGTNNSTATPVAVSGLTSGVSAVAAGLGVSYAVLANGTVDAWGDDSAGELGDAGNPPASCQSQQDPCAMVPQPVPGLSAIAAVDGSGFGGIGTSVTDPVDYALALAANGTAQSWGASVYGELGDGNENGTTSPAPIPGLSGVSAVAAGGAGAMALVGAGPPGDASGASGATGSSGGSGSGTGSGGTGSGGGSGGGSTGASGPAASGSGPGVAALALRCTRRALTLTDVLPRGGRVFVQGAAATSAAGRRVTISMAGRAVGRTSVRRNGLFSVTVPLPPAAVRAAGRAVYQAALGKQRSSDLALSRRLVLDPPHASGRTVTLTGRVVPPLASPAAPVAILLERSCTKSAVVRRVRPASDGSFHATVRAPAGVRAAVYRVRTSVPGASGPLLSLPEVVALG